MAGASKTPGSTADRCHCERSDEAIPRDCFVATPLAMTRSQLFSAGLRLGAERFFGAAGFSPRVSVLALRLRAGVAAAGFSAGALRDRLTRRGVAAGPAPPAAVSRP